MTSPESLLLDRAFEYALNRMEAAGQADEPAKHDYGEKRRAIFAYVAELQRALAKSVELQAHYATLLNEYDGGKRHSFRDAQEWIERLRATEGEIK